MQPPRKPSATGAFRKTGKSTNFLKRSIFFLKPSARIHDLSANFILLYKT